jgi:hypothetical protein
MADEKPVLSGAERSLPETTFFWLLAKKKYAQFDWVSLFRFEIILRKEILEVVIHQLVG